MQAIFYIILISFGLVFSDVKFSTQGVSQVSDEAEMISTLDSQGNVSERNWSPVLEVYHKITDGFMTNIQNISEITVDSDFGWLLENNESAILSTEISGVDANGCDRSHREQLEKGCDDEYERVSEDAHNIEDRDEMTEALCCALEDFEKCNLRAFDKAGCGTDKEAIKENMKAARLFVTMVANVTCSKFRGLCAYYSSAPPINSTDLLSSEEEFITQSDSPIFDDVNENMVTATSFENETESMFEIDPEISDGFKNEQNTSEMTEDNEWPQQEHESIINSTESSVVDVSGCNKSELKRLKERCDEEYERVMPENLHTEIDDEKAEVICCALQEFEKCSLQAHDKTGCGTDKAAIRENVKAARLFLILVANVRCSKFNGFCSRYSPTTSDHDSDTGGISALLFTLLTIL